MAAIKLTPQQKIEKQRRDNLLALCNRIASAFNFKNIKSWTDVYVMEGMDAHEVAMRYPTTFDKPVTYAELKVHFDKRKQELEDDIAKVVKLAEQPEQPIAEVKLIEATDETGLSNDNDYGLPPSEKENVSLFWFQKLATTKLLKGLEIIK